MTFPKFPKIDPNAVICTSRDLGLLPTPARFKTLDMAVSAHQKVREAMDGFASLGKQIYGQNQRDHGISYGAWLHTHTEAQTEAHKKLLAALQTYNDVIGDNQKAAIATLDTPFMVPSEVVRQSSSILKTIERDEIELARNQAQLFVCDAPRLWGTSKKDDSELQAHFEQVASQLTKVLEQFDQGDCATAVANYHRIYKEYEGYNTWMMSSLRHSNDLKSLSAGLLGGLTAFLL